MMPADNKLLSRRDNHFNASHPLILRKATPADVDALAEVYLSSFVKNPWSSLVYPYTKASYDWWRFSLSNDIKNPNSHFLCVYDSSIPWQPIVSWARWDDPNAIVETTPPAWPAGSDEKAANYFFNLLIDTHERHMKGRKHWYMRFLSTRPEYEGKGAAGQLLRWLIDRADADADGCELYLEASPVGKPIYEHFGFVEVDRVVLELEGKGEGAFGKKEYMETCMVRPARGMEKGQREKGNIRSRL
ncbi:acetyltransferase-like protein [Xylogone sp. PMI_703]|nr:acetyltransferase-like protein [Xylogone sp. PMI_703]